MNSVGTIQSYSCLYDSAHLTLTVLKMMDLLLFMRDMIFLDLHNI